jgi:hypothetical protein
VAGWEWSSLGLHERPDRPEWYIDGPVRRAALAGVCSSAADRRRTGRPAARRAAGRAVWRRAMAESDDRRAEPGEHHPPWQPAEEAS